MTKIELTLKQIALRTLRVSALPFAQWPADAETARGTCKLKEAIGCEGPSQYADTDFATGAPDPSC
jgi:hypothetical protein